MGLSDELVEPFEPLTNGAAAVVLDARYGIPNAAVSRLESERDDTFHVESEFGEFVLKVAHPADDPLLINLQTSAMGFASEVDPDIPLQRVLPTLDGEIEALLETDAGERVMRVLTWLPGEMLSVAPKTETLLEAFGEGTAKLDRALEDFRHPAAERALAWDIRRLPELRDLLSAAPDLEPFVDRVAALDLDALPHQVLHNDLNHHNVLVEGVRVSGILDFGDTVYTVRVAELAVAMSYLIDPGVGWASVEPVAAGYQRINPLTPAELDVLPTLVAGRLAQRILLGSWRAKATGSFVIEGNLEHSRAQLEALR